ncbi:lipoprotein insertase outer membrane protein LolB [Hydrogenophaga sp.]|uniref:lipoprotein insertase outer membrane protein LolB n=1 Tax=Hydrogenophaga sp. TaxID=1904254 RepID=UPI0025BBF66B|nr:lipoprotein insertase outer membrane protein LolB [Hydrogenophaga sp.]
MPSWTGRLAVRVDSVPAQAFSADFVLSGRPVEGELRLSTPLGQTIAIVRWSATKAEMQRGNEFTTRENLDRLTTELTGAPLPVAALFDWLGGRDTPQGGWQVDLSRHADGRLVARRAQPLPSAELRLVLDQ